MAIERSENENDSFTFGEVRVRSCAVERMCRACKNKIDRRTNKSGEIVRTLWYGYSSAVIYLETGAVSENCAQFSKVSHRRRT